MKKIIFCFVFLNVLVPWKATCQTISDMFFAQNYWMPNNGPFGGSLDSYWQQIKDSGVKWMRIGGISYDANAAGSYTWTPTDLASGTTLQK